MADMAGLVDAARRSELFTAPRLEARPGDVSRRAGRSDSAAGASSSRGRVRPRLSSSAAVVRGRTCTAVSTSSIDTPPSHRTCYQLRVDLARPGASGREVAGLPGVLLGRHRGHSGGASPRQRRKRAHGRDRPPPTQSDGQRGCRGGRLRLYRLVHPAARRGDAVRAQLARETEGPNRDDAEAHCAAPGLPAMLGRAYREGEAGGPRAGATIPEFARR